MAVSEENEYVLGTHDAEVERLGLQHRVWRPRALDAWRRAGFTAGQTFLDAGCGPGYAALDLAEIAGPAGRVIALDRSERFLQALESESRRRGLHNITTHPADFDRSAPPIPRLEADGVWVRWVFAFVKDPERLLRQIAGSMRRGAALVIHEYFHYATWKMAPRCAELEEFVTEVISSWRAENGEPDIAPSLCLWLEQLGFELKTVAPLVDVVTQKDYAWQWLKAFIQTGSRRLADLGRISAARAGEIREAFSAREASGNCLMISPAVLEVIAVRRPE